MGDLEAFFTPDVLARLSKLGLASGKLAGGGGQADRTSKRTGTGTEFADHREYIHGDDPRQIDWRLYGRTGKFFTKLYHSEEDRRISIAIDTSASMVASPGKFESAKRLAAALTFLATNDGDSAKLFAFDSKVKTPMGQVRGNSGFRRSLDWLEDLQPGGTTDIQEASKELARLCGSKGPLIMISDFMDSRLLSTRWPAALGGGARETSVIQVFSPSERTPEHRGYIRVMDCEGSGAMPVLLDSRLAKRYTETFDRYCLGLESRCSAVGVRYARVSTRRPLLDVVTKDLRKAGITS